MKKSLILFLFAGVCCAQSPQVPVTGNLGSGGVFPLVTSPAVIFTADSDHTMGYPEVSGSSGVMVVTSSVSLTATRNLIAPLTKGFEWAIKNATTGGRSIQIIGSSGSGVTIGNGATALVFCDGSNYLNVGSISFPGIGVANSTGSGWDTSYQVGTSANNLVQLNSSAVLPAVSGANLTNLNGANLQNASVPNNALGNPSVTINGSPCTLGGSCTVAASGNTSGVTLAYIGSSGGSVVCGSSTSCTASRGYLVVTMPSSAAAGDYVQATFGTAYSSNPVCILTQNNSGSNPTNFLDAGVRAVTNSFTMSLGNAPTPSGVYVFAYTCQQ